VDIGLISPASIEAYGKTLETGKMFANLKLEFKLGISRNDIDDKFADAEKYLEVQRDEISESERESRASALWHNNNRVIASIYVFSDIFKIQVIVKAIAMPTCD